MSGLCWSHKMSLKVFPPVFNISFFWGEGWFQSNFITKTGRSPSLLTPGIYQNTLLLLLLAIKHAQASSHLVAASPLSLDMGYLFLMGSRVLLLMVVQQLCNFSGLAEGDECASFYSAILNKSQ